MISNPASAENAQVQDDADRKAREIRKRDMLNVCLAVVGGEKADIGMACDMAQEAVATALREAEQRGMMRIKEDARLPFLTVFLDGRNEHGSHVLPMPGDSIGNERHLLDIQNDLEDQDEGMAERIISEAESLGFEIGHCVVTIWRHVDGADFPGNDYFEYVSISEALTVLFCGSPAEQREDFERAASPEAED